MCIGKNLVDFLLAMRVDNTQISMNDRDDSQHYSPIVDGHIPPEGVVWLVFQLVEVINRHDERIGVDPMMDR